MVLIVRTIVDERFFAAIVATTSDVSAHVSVTVSTIGSCLHILSQRMTYFQYTTSAINTHMSVLEKSVLTFIIRGFV